MKNIRILIAILAIAISFTTTAQVKKFGKVSTEELQQAQHPLHPEADAAFLFRDVRVYYSYVKEKGFVLNKEVHERIKIYNKAGLEWANVTDRYYVGGNSDESITRIKGATYNLVGGKVETTKLDKSGIFDEEYDDFWSIKKLALPKVKEGSVIEYKYLVTSAYTRSIDEILLQNLIPIDYQDVRFEIPEYYSFRPIVRGNISLNPEKSKTTKTQNFALGAKTVGEGLNARTVSGGQGSISFDINKTRYEMRNVEPLIPESHVYYPRNYVGAINMELQYVRYPNGGLREYTSSWESVSKTVSQDVYADVLDRSVDFGSDFNSTLSGYTDPKDRMNVVFTLIKQKVTWNKEKSIFPRQSIKKTLEEGKGNSAAVNLTLLKALREAGLEAYPVLVSTKSNGIPVYPTLDGFNYVIAAVNIDNGLFLLDGTSVASLPNVLPDRAMNWQGRLLLPDGGSQFIGLMPNYLSKHVVNMLIKLDESFDINGQCREQFTNHYGKNMRSKVAADEGKEYLSDLNDGTLYTENSSVKNLTKLSDPLTLSYSFSMEDAIEEIDGKRYLNPFAFMAMEDNPFKSETRTFPVDYIFPKEDKIMINMTLPEGYTAEFVPESMNIALPDGMGSYSVKFALSGNSLSVSSSLKLNNAVFSADSYPYLKEFIAKVFQKQQERIILSKS